jgi:hypothetical protein
MSKLKFYSTGTRHWNAPWLDLHSDAVMQRYRTVEDLQRAMKRGLSHTWFILLGWILSVGVTYIYLTFFVFGQPSYQK